jgi:hypothetical protein
MISFGLTLGATWSEFFGRWLLWFWLVFLVAGAYVISAWYTVLKSSTLRLDDQTATIW